MRVSPALNGGISSFAAGASTASSCIFSPTPLPRVGGRLVGRVRARSFVLDCARLGVPLRGRMNHYNTGYRTSGVGRVACRPSPREMTHHHNVVVKDAANIEGAGGTTTEPWRLWSARAYWRLVPKSHGCAPALRHASAARSTSAMPLPSWRRRRNADRYAASANLSGRTHSSRSLLADDRQRVSDEGTIDFGDQYSVPSG